MQIVQLALKFKNSSTPVHLLFPVGTPVIPKSSLRNDKVPKLAHSIPVMKVDGQISVSEITGSLSLHYNLTKFRYIYLSTKLNYSVVLLRNPE